jgi:hypothetical protein
VEPAPHGLINVSHARFVVASDHQFKLRHEGEEILPHEARADGIAPSKCFDFCFGPQPAFLCLNSGDEAGAHETCEVCWMQTRMRDGESLYRGRRVVVTEDSAQGIYKN